MNIDSTKKLIALMVMIIAVFASTVCFALSAEVEDITPKYPAGWESQDQAPERITPVLRSRKMETYKIEPVMPPVKIPEKTISLADMEKTGGGEGASAAGAKDAGVATATEKIPITPETVKVDAPPPAPEKTVKPPPPLISQFPPKRTLKKGPISGRVQVKYQDAGASGDEVGYLAQQGLVYFNDRIQQSARIAVDKRYENGMRIEGLFIDQPYQDTHLHFSAIGNGWNAKVGDVVGRFRGGEMTALSKQIRGLDIEYDFGPASVFAVMSREKSDTKRETFKGRNFRGPYVLRSTSILENSESVYLNGVPLSPADYRMDYFLGQITFNMNVDSTDVVEITYESVLQVAVRTGAMNGFGVFTDQKKKYSGGLSYMEEGTAKTRNQTIFQTTDTFAAPATGVEYPLSANYLKTYSEVVYISGAAGNEYLGRGDDYEIKYYTAEYEKGTIKFSAGAFPATATVTVKYEYYNEDYLQRVGDGVTEERISGSGENIFELQREKVYPGPETAYLYVNGDQLLKRLEAGIDYEISEANNSIIFLRDETTPVEADGTSVVISYKIVPPNEPIDTLAKRRVFDLYGKGSLGGVNLGLEYSDSKSDITLKSIQVTEERVATVATTTQTIYPLQFDAISGTEEIYLNDALFSGSRLRPGVDYVLEYNANYAGMVMRLVKEIEIGNTIIANYKYAPVISGDEVKDGNAGRLLADYSFRNGKASMEYMLKSAYFSPLTAFNDLERQRFDFAAEMKPWRSFSFNFHYRNQQRRGDMSSGVIFRTGQFGLGMKYLFGDGSSIGYSMENIATTDNRAISLTDTSRWMHRLDGRYAPTGNKKILTDFYIESRDMSDSTGRTSDQSMLKAGVGASFNPDETLRLRMTASTNSAKYDAPVGIDPAYGDFDAGTFSSTFDATWLPDSIWSVNAGYDIQEKSASKNLYAGSDSVHTIRGGVISKPMGKITRISLNFDRKDRPNPEFGDSRAEAAAFKLAYALNKNWTLSPTLSLTKSSVQERSRSENMNSGLQVDYRQYEQLGWIGSAQYSSNSRDSARTNSALDTWVESSTNQDRLISSLKYGAQRYIWKNALTINDISAAKSRRASASTTFDYLYSERTKLALGYNLDSAPSASGRRSRLTFSSSTVMNENFTLGLTYKKEKRGGARAYDGDLFNMTLDMEF